VHGSENVAGWILSTPVSYMKVNGGYVELHLLVGVVHCGVVAGDEAKQPHQAASAALRRLSAGQYFE
jgi:hypothetical protein